MAMLSLGGRVKERVMAARRGVFRSGVHGVVGNESDMAVRKHAAGVGYVGGRCSSRDSGICVVGQGCVAGYIRRSLRPTGWRPGRSRPKECEWIVLEWRYLDVSNVVVSVCRRSNNRLPRRSRAGVVASLP